MAKTCRACKAAFWVLECDFGCPCDEINPDVCHYHAERETPLLVDDLAEGCKLAFAKLDFFLTEQATCPMPLGIVVACLAAALARYEKEVGDAELP